MRAFAVLVVALGLLGCAWVQAAEPDPSGKEQAMLKQRMCEDTRCQRDVRISMLDEDGKLYETTYDVFPAIVQKLGVLVVSGQTIYVEAEVADNKLVNLVAVDRITKPAMTITLNLVQLEDRGMLLTVNNPFSKMLKFDMAMTPLSYQKMVKTSSCPVTAGGVAYEQWPYPITQILLQRARLLEPSASMSCEK
ncbi:MAG: hypothetical protein ACJ8GW_19830 [Massilia sp.]